MKRRLNEKVKFFDAGLIDTTFIWRGNFITSKTSLSHQEYLAATC